MAAGFRAIIGRAADRTAIRWVNRCLLLLVAALLLTQTASAQETTPLSPSVVLVLKLVSATHVKPTTGIVVSDHGLVVVSADFVSEQGEIIVLDGGTDITSHGRSAVILERSKSSGLALLSVEGLERPGFKMSADTLSADSSLHLAAFPPAEYIAKGAQPLWLPVKMHGDGSTAVSPDTPLPYVSGSIIDDCGYLAGLSLTLGPQSLVTGKKPVIIFTSELERALGAMQINLPRANCGNISRDEIILANYPPEAEEQKVARLENEIIPDENVATPVLELAVAEVPVVQARPAAVKVTAPASLWRSVPLWLPVLGIIILAALIWKGILFFRISAEQTNHSAGGPRTAPGDEAKPLDMNALPQDCNAVLLIEGMLDRDTGFKRFCAVDRAQFDVVIGRGEVDLSIDHPSISPIHTRIEGDGQSMTLSDLGSSHGTYIRGIPCLSGEVMFIEAADEIHLGEVHFQITLITKEATLS